MNLIQTLAATSCDEQDQSLQIHKAAEDETIKTMSTSLLASYIRLQMNWWLHDQELSYFYCSPGMEFSLRFNCHCMTVTSEANIRHGWRGTSRI